MANYYRPVTTHYVDAEGRRKDQHGRHYTATSPGVRPKRHRGKTFRARYTLADGTDCDVSLQTRDEDEARERLAELLKREKNRQHDPYAEHRDTPLSDHLDDFRRHLEAKNSSEKHVAKSMSYCGKIIDACGFKRLDHFDANTVADYLHQRRQPVPVTEITLKQAAEIIGDAGQIPPSIPTLKRLKPPAPTTPAQQGTPARWSWSIIRPWLQQNFSCDLPRQCPLPDEAGISIHASNDYLAAIKAFANWLVRSRRMPENPLRFLSKLNPKTELVRKHERRAASLDDFSKLLTATAEGNPFRGLTGQDRVMLYLTAVSTGFRASELASLTSSSFDLDAETPTVTVQAAYSKRRRTDTRPLRSDLAAMFRDYFDAISDTRQGDLIPIRSKRRSGRERGRRKRP